VGHTDRRGSRQGIGALALQWAPDGDIDDGLRDARSDFIFFHFAKNITVSKFSKTQPSKTEIWTVYFLATR
jgi:hypothetical protein